MSDAVVPPTNIGADGRRFHVFIGVIFVFFAMAFAGLLTVTGMPWPLRLTVLLPAWISAMCLLPPHTTT